MTPEELSSIRARTHKYALEAYPVADRDNWDIRALDREELLAEVDLLKLEIGALTIQLRQANEEVRKLYIAADQAYGNGYACGLAAASARTLEDLPEDMPDVDPMF